MFKRKSSDQAEPKAKAKPAKKPAPKRPKPGAAQVVVQKPDTDVYFVMLVLSFLSIVVACILLLLELSRYGSYPWWNAS
jgi:hypothetical protein